MTLMRGSTVVNGQTIDTTYDSDSYGDPWTATVGDETVRSSTENALVSKIRNALKRQEVPIHVEFVDPATGRRGAVVGQHAGRNVSMIAWSDLTRETTDIQLPLRPDTDLAALRDLRTASITAERALAAFLREHQIKRANGRPVHSTTALVHHERERLAPDTETATS